jgi:hypothetical protein
MPVLRRRPLRRAAMVGGAGYAVGRQPQHISPEAERLGALTKLEGLLESGVLTREQFEEERQRMLSEG